MNMMDNAEMDNALYVVKSSAGYIRVSCSNDSLIQCVCGY